LTSGVGGPFVHPLLLTYFSSPGSCQGGREMIERARNDPKRWANGVYPWRGQVAPTIAQTWVRTVSELPAP
jgi:hypothetical protein